MALQEGPLHASPRAALRRTSSLPQEVGSLGGARPRAMAAGVKGVPEIPDGREGWLPGLSAASCPAGSLLPPHH